MGWYKDFVFISITIYNPLKYFLDKKRFILDEPYIEIPTNYGTINNLYETTNQLNVDNHQNQVYNI